MKNVGLVSGLIGAIHLFVSVIAVAAGSYILFAAKGTRRHKQIGYIYAVSMIVVNATAFMIYRLYGRFGIFHWLAVVSSLTLIAGLLPIISRKPRNSYVELHFNFMYWSVIGLYGALVAETLVRIPPAVFTNTGQLMPVFYTMVGIGTGLTMMLGAIFYFRNKGKWEKQFSQKL